MFIPDTCTNAVPMLRTGPYVITRLFTAANFFFWEPLLPLTIILGEGIIDKLHLSICGLVQANWVLARPCLLMEHVLVSKNQARNIFKQPVQMIYFICVLTKKNKKLKPSPKTWPDLAHRMDVGTNFLAETNCFFPERPKLYPVYNA